MKHRIMGKRPWQGTLFTSFKEFFLQLVFKAEGVQDFLTNRVQRVVVNGFESDWSDVTSGIPQGSVLGPILFLIYINDLLGVVEILMKLFADGAKLYHTVTNRRENELQLNLDRAVKWAKDWEILYNTDKCHQLHVWKQETVFRYTHRYLGSVIFCV